MEDEDLFLYGESAEEQPKTAFQAELNASNVPLGQPYEGQETFSGAATGEEAEEGEEEDIVDDDSDEDLDIILDGDASRPVAPIRPRPLPALEAREDPKQPTSTARDESTTEYKPHDRSDPNALLKPSMLSITPAGPGSSDRNRFPTPPPDPNADPPLAAPPIEPPPDVNVEAVIVSGYEDKDGTALTNFDFDAVPEVERGWRKPGAHVADWFNYGFDEATWRTYVAKQKRLRGEETRQSNPWAAFATGDLQEAWASLPPELKGLMMQTVIGAGMGGPGGGAPGGMNGMPGLPPMPGMDPMMMNGFGLGMPGGMPGLPPHMMSGPPPMALQNHMGGQTPLNGPPGMPIMQMDRGPIPVQEPAAPSEGGGGGDHGIAGFADMDGSQMGQDPSFGGGMAYPVGQEYLTAGMDPNAMYNGDPSSYQVQGYGGPDQMSQGAAGRGRGIRGGRAGRGGASGFLAAAAARGRGRGAPGQPGASSPAVGPEASPDRPGGGRVNAPLPTNIPTGPRASVPAPTAPRGPRGDSRSYHDKDAAGGRGDDGLDYGGAGDSPHDDRKRRHRDHDDRSERSRSRDRGDREDSDRDGHRSSRHRHRRHRSRSRSHESVKSSRDKTAYDDDGSEAYKSKSSSSRRSRRDRDHRDRDRDRDDDGRAQDSEDDYSSSRKRKSKDDRSDRERSSRSSKRERTE